MAPQRKNPEETDEVTLEGKRRDHHAKSICLEMSKANGPVQSIKKKKRNTPDYFNTNYCADIKLVSIS